jgi:hypothetical protein
LNPQDRIVFFRLTRFFLCLQRHVRRLQQERGDNGDEVAAQSIEVSLMAAMDLYCFGLVHRSVEEYISEKKWPGLEYASELLVEMISFLL